MSAVLLLAAAVASVATGGGRKPYGGSVDVQVRDLGALWDPQAAVDRSGRMLATLGHCHLFRPVQVAAGGGRIDIVPELAAGPGSFNDGTLTVTLVEGARFHDDAPITPADVVASWRRLGQVGPLRALAGAVKASEAGPRAVAFAFGRGAQLDEVMALLARPEAAVLHGGRPVSGAGCGPFRAASATPDSSGRLLLQAFAGHPEGRPWLDQIRVKVRADAESALATSFRYGEIDLAWEPVAGGPVGAANLGGGWASWMAVVRPGLKTPERTGLRRRMLALTRDARLARYVEGRAVAATTPWPDAFAPTSATVPAGDAGAVLTGLVIAYPDGDDELAELARALRDSLRLMASDNARVVPVAKLTAANAAAQSDPIWDLAVVRHEWAALTRDQAALELGDVLGMGGLSPSEVFAGQTRRWADGLTTRVDVLPLVHAPRGVLVTASLRGVDASAGVPGLCQGFRPRPPSAGGSAP